jgi:hypothetical protein
MGGKDRETKKLWKMNYYDEIFSICKNRTSKNLIGAKHIMQ